MKSTPWVLSESTAATALSGVLTAIELGNRSFPSAQIPVQHRPRDNHPRPDDFPTRDLPAPLRKNRDISTHIAHSGHAIRDEKWQDDVASTWKPIPKGGVHMHIPKPWNEILPSGIDHP